MLVSQAGGVRGEGRLASRSSSAFAVRATLLVSLAGGERKGSESDVEAFVCSQRPGQRCSSVWLVVAGGQAEVEAFGRPRGPGRHCLCHWLGAWWVGVPMVGAHRHSPCHGSAVGPLAFLECGGQLRSVCALLGVCVPMLGAHRHSPGHGQCPWADGIVGMRRSASHSMCVAWCVSRCLRQRSAATLKPVIACLGTGLTGIGAILKQGTTVSGLLFRPTSLRWLISR